MPISTISAQPTAPTTSSARVPTPSRSPRARLWIGVGTLLVFGVALYVLQRSLADTSWRAIRHSAAAVPGLRLALAALCTLGSYGALTLYDMFALHVLGQRLPYWKVALTSFTAFGLSNTLGLSTLSGGSVRLKSYTAQGLSPLQVAAVQLLCSATFFLGAGVITGIELSFHGHHLARVLHLAPWLVRGVGLSVLVVLVAYLAATYRSRRPLRISAFVLTLPTFRQTALQAAIGVLDLACAAGALYVLLPANSLRFQTLLPAYVLSMVVGAVSNVPGALGVFESGLLLLLPSVSVQHLLGAALVYRGMYSFVPFVGALALLIGRELLPLSQQLSGHGHTLVRWITGMAPQLLAATVFLCGVVLTFSGATPAVSSRLDFLRGLVPLSVLELSHLLGSVFGLALMILARGIYRRLDAAYLLVQALMAGAILASLLKGGDYEESALLLLVMALLYGARRRFTRRAALLELSWPWLLQISLVLGTGLWVGMLAYRHVDYSRELWWQFAFDAGASRMLRATLLSALLFLSYALWQLLRPTRPEMKPVSRAELERVAELVDGSDDTMACLALTGDKQLMFSDQRDAFIMYAASGGTLIALGDPVGAPAARTELAWRYRELCDHHGMRCVFYQVKAQNLPLYLDLGLSLAKLGEEAHVLLQEFHLQGRDRSMLRAAQRKVTQGPLSFRVLEPAEVRARMPELTRVSETWLAHKPGAEKGFSIGRFLPDYIGRQPCAVIEQSDRIIAFANLLHASVELSVDLMRYADEAPHGVMDGLLVNLMLWGKARGLLRFNLGMAPLSGLYERPLAPLWHKAGLAIHTYGQGFYNFEGLRRYKEKFHPVWTPRYLASPGGIALPRVLLDTATLIAGGVRAVVAK